MSDPTSPDNTIKLPTVKQIATAFINLAEGLFVAFSPIFPGSPWCLGLCGPTYGPESALGPPFYRGQPLSPPPPLHFLPVTTIASANRNSAPVSVNAVSIPQGSGVQQSADVSQNGAQQSEAGRQDGRVQQNDATQNVVVNLSTAKPVEEPPALLPQGSGVQQSADVSQNRAQQSEAGRQDGRVQQNDATQNVVVNLSTAKPVEEPPALQRVSQTAAPQADQGPPTAQTSNGTSNQSTTTSTNPADAQKPKVSVGGSKFELRKVSSNDARRGGLAGAPNAKLDQSGSSRSADPSKGFNGAWTSSEPTHSGSK